MVHYETITLCQYKIHVNTLKFLCASTTAFQSDIITTLKFKLKHYLGYGKLISHTLYGISEGKTLLKVTKIMSSVVTEIIDLYEQ